LSSRPSPLHAACSGRPAVPVRNDDVNGEQLELNTVRGILVIQACIVAYYVITIALAFVRAIMGWNPKKGALDPCPQPLVGRPF
jgi:hypothetical protein